MKNINSHIAEMSEGNTSNDVYDTALVTQSGQIHWTLISSQTLICNGRGYNYKQILSVVNDNLRKYESMTIASQKVIFNILAKTKKMLRNG